MSGGLKEFVSYEEACVLLNLTPRVFRAILTDFEAEITAVQTGLDVPGKHLTVGAYERLQRVVEMRGAGSADAEIKAALSSMTPASAEAAATARPAVIAFPTPTPASEVPAVYDPDLTELGPLMEKVSLLLEHLQAIEERQREERDRLLNTLLRMQQEVQSLRHELTAQKSRRDRKKSFWVRLWEF